MRDYLETGEVTVFNEAVYKAERIEKLVSAGEWSTLKQTGRNIDSKGFELSEIEIKTVSVKTVLDRLDRNAHFTLLMNCECSGYVIIDEILKGDYLTATLISQMYAIGENPIKCCTRRAQSLLKNLLRLFVTIGLGIYVNEMTCRRFWQKNLKENEIRSIKSILTSIVLIRRLVCGARGGNWTRDLRITSALLYH